MTSSEHHCIATLASSPSLPLTLQHRAALSKYRSQRLEQSELEEELQRLDARADELAEDKSRATSELMDASDQSSKLHESLKVREP